MNKDKQIYEHNKETMEMIREMIMNSKKQEVKECVECGHFEPCNCELK